MKVCFFGDSICNGQGIAIHRGWVTRLSATLADVGAEYGTDVLVMNSSVNGRTTRKALENMPYEVQSHGVDVIIIQFGMNDCNIWATDRGNPRVSPAAFEANLHEIIARARAFGARRFFLNTNHPTARDVELLPHSDTTYEIQNQKYNEIIRKVVASERYVRLNDIAKSFDAAIDGNRQMLESTLLPDHLHLSELGHAMYFDQIATAITAAVAALLAE